MIRYIKRAVLDVDKYNNCIENSINARIYAYSWYLDIVADNWDVLVLDDYAAVMPLPWRSKYFIKYIYMPCWTQQLGIFSSIDLTSVKLNDFINSIPKKFKKVTLNFNSDNLLKGSNIQQKTNYILPLNKQYFELFENYKYRRRRSYKQYENDTITIKKSSKYKEVVNLFINQKKGTIQINKSDYDKLEQLIKFSENTKQSYILTVENLKGELIGGAFFLKDTRRITYLFSAVSVEGRKKQAMPFIIDLIIKKYANTNYIFDFEGSMIPGIAYFFRSFGAQEETYFSYQKQLFFNNKY